MKQIQTTAPAKIILLGEHAVVYGKPAIAIPIHSVTASAEIIPSPSDKPFHILSEAIGLDSPFSELQPDAPLRKLIELIQKDFNLKTLPPAVLRIASTIPPASGLGSGAAVSVSVIRAFMQGTGIERTDGQVSALSYEIEKIYHGTPSGIDNTVISLNRPICFRKGKPIQMLHLSASLPLIVVNSGIYSETAIAVGDVRAHYSENESAIKSIGELVERTIPIFESGSIPSLGAMMTENHRWLQAINVSCERLDQMVNFALAHGALGAKLTGAGRGGNIIALAADMASADELRSAFGAEGYQVIA